jgi:hypothetical protein
MHVSVVNQDQALNLTFELYDVKANPLQDPDTLPWNALFNGSFRSNETNGASEHHITLDNGRLLGIPHDQPLPNGATNNVTVDLRPAMDNVGREILPTYQIYR